MKSYYKTMKSPIGGLTLIAGPKELLAILWKNETPGHAGYGTPEKNDRHPVLVKTEKQLQEYFTGKRKTFRLPLPDAAAGTEFQNRVWKALRDIPYGETISYGELARRIGSPQACRAVGAACGRNPISIITPCHRVIGKSGDLVGFGGGLHRKEQLLRLEQAFKKKRRPPEKH
jgi:methylated-DNA-[protein]-cysteine S-methyltransferase